jgi:hypothetical protein
MGNWQDDDAQLSGFGLFDNEIKEKNTPRVKKNDPATRNKRPRSEWTTMDVAAEFEARVRSLMPVMPGKAFSVKDLSGALAKQRRTSNVNAVIELELMDMFFEDPWVQHEGRQSPGFIMGRFLKSFTIRYGQALKNLHMDATEAPEDVSEMVAPVEDFVYASDGRRFDNSMPGRKALERHEAELRRTNEL